MLFRLLPVLLLVTGGWGGKAVAGEELPPPPRQYVTDEAGVITPALVAQLNQRLAAFERATSNQIVAVVSNRLPDGASLEDYAQRLYSAWKIGGKKNSNGVLMLVFVQDRKVRIQSGYGLEGALPDVLCNRIIRETMAPAFRSGKYGVGLAAGIQAVMQATKGEYKGSGKTSEKSAGLLDLLFSPLGFFLLVLLVLVISARRRALAGGGIDPAAAAATGFFLGGGGGGWGGGSGGGGFSGGGGESGGGGSSGNW